jgi:hypothetical protein
MIACRWPRIQVGMDTYSIAIRRWGVHLGRAFTDLRVAASTLK